MEVLLFAFGVVVGAAAAWFFGHRTGREQGTRETRGELASLAEGLKAGNLPDPDRTDDGEVPEVREMRQVLARRWAPRPGDGEDETARALGRIAADLRHRVESPLLAGLDAGGQVL